MEKRLLMQRLAKTREQAEAANLEVVVQTALMKQLERERRGTDATRVHLSRLKMREQKLLREMEWVLDQLDRLAR